MSDTKDKISIVELTRLVSRLKAYSKLLLTTDDPFEYDGYKFLINKIANDIYLTHLAPKIELSTSEKEPLCANCGLPKSKHIADKYCDKDDHSNYEPVI